MMLHSLQWSTLEMKMPVVYYGTESGSYKYFKLVSLSKVIDVSIKSHHFLLSLLMF